MSGRKEREKRKQERIVAEQHAEGEQRRRLLLQIASAAAFIAIVAVVVLIVVNSSGGGGGDASNLEGAGEANAELQGIPQQGMALGDPKAPVKLIEFGDLKCPVCASFAKEIVPDVIDSSVRGEEARIEFRNFTIIDDQSEVAGAAALAAGEQGRGWNFLEIFYRNQGEETEPYADDEFLTAVAKAAKVPDIAAWNEARKSSKLLAQVRKTTDEARKLGFEGTPSFAVEGPGGKRELLYTPNSASEIESAIAAAR